MVTRDTPVRLVHTACAKLHISGKLYYYLYMRSHRLCTPTTDATAPLPQMPLHHRHRCHCTTATDATAPPPQMPLHYRHRCHCCTTATDVNVQRQIDANAPPHIHANAQAHTDVNRCQHYRAVLTKKEALGRQKTRLTESFFLFVLMVCILIL